MSDDEELEESAGAPPAPPDVAPDAAIAGPSRRENENAFSLRHFLREPGGSSGSAGYERPAARPKTERLPDFVQDHMRAEFRDSDSSPDLTDTRRRELPPPDFLPPEPDLRAQLERARAELAAERARADALQRQLDEPADTDETVRRLREEVRALRTWEASATRELLGLRRATDVYLRLLRDTLENLDQPDPDPH